MVEFKGIGIVSLSQEGDYDNSEKIITLKSKFKWFLTDEFRELREGFVPESVTKPTISIDQFRAKVELQGKTPPSNTTVNESKDNFECYYCNEFSSTMDKQFYERHVVIEHPRRLAYPTEMDLKKLGIKSKGKKWEN